MNAKDFEKRMRQYESYHKLRVSPGVWIVLRLDGRNFHTLTTHLEHPFDPLFHYTMETTATDLMVEFNAVFAETHSDEISLLLGPDNDIFGRSVEKLVSVPASRAAGMFNHANQTFEAQASFDCRIVQLPTNEAVVDYFSWRQSDCETNCINSWAYWLLCKGHTPAETTAILNGIGRQEQLEILKQFGVKYAKLPEWQRNGTGVTWREWITSSLEGSSSVLGVPSAKRRTALRTRMPYRDEYRSYILRLCEKYIERNLPPPTEEDFDLDQEMEFEVCAPTVSSTNGERKFDLTPGTPITSRIFGTSLS